ncbi:MAG: phytanoyl-CoA dioxygenase family protein [Caldilineaceae bacterium SB0670_bin_27]|uniref:Phytanoyl-CoA dioxygenase family protein n=1 Tax=Caldilineaceae bacterium SB0664_bin_27 TaxID=2605260 RepID=A0A6B0YXA1_9CHLR|nr:phytanoyl-CoA dioxygenase family protein [Caldilineaceae bacterium SB0664_bin_27]MYJ79798.1 phytanoyl-CoA dioxygenase family protein [Caldilineaceae bacterium SB0670_bin_27]
MTVTAPERQFDDGLTDEFPPDLYAPTGVVTGVDGFDAVTDAHVAQFHEQGFLIVENAFSAHEVQVALDGLFHLLSGEVEEFNGVQYERASAGVAVEEMPLEEKQDYVRKFMSFVDYDERLNELAHHPLLLALVERLIGDSPVMFQSMALLKPPRLGRDKPWHQDAAYFQIELDAKVVGCWIALDEATIENGCMVIAPGSHLKGPVVHFRRRDWQICDTDVDNSGAVAVPLKPGGLLIFQSLLHHGTPPNDSGLRRRALQFHYRPQSAPLTSQEERLAIFGGEGLGAEC